MITKDCVAAKLKKYKKIIKKLSKKAEQVEEIVLFLCSMIAVKTCGGSPAILSLKNWVDFGGHVDQQDTDSAVCYLDN